MLDWDAIGAVGEMLGSIAMFVTLGYLAVQVRHARSETRRSLSQGRMVANRELITMELLNLEPHAKVDVALGLEPVLAVTAMMDVAGLTFEEAYRAFMVEISGWNYRVWAITHIEDLPLMERQLFDGALRVKLRTSGVAQIVYEKHTKPMLSTRVLQYVERALAEKD